MKQKDIIGAVGSTGMSTGPHCITVLRNGSHVNPQAQKFKRGKPLTGTALERYLDAVSRSVTDLTRLVLRPVGRPIVKGLIECRLLYFS